MIHGNKYYFFRIGTACVQVLSTSLRCARIAAADWSTCRWAGYEISYPRYHYCKVKRFAVPTALDNVPRNKIRASCVVSTCSIHEV